MRPEPDVAGPALRSSVCVAVGLQGVVAGCTSHQGRVVLCCIAFQACFNAAVAMATDVAVAAVCKSGKHVGGRHALLALFVPSKHKSHSGSCRLPWGCSGSQLSAPGSPNSSLNTYRPASTCGVVFAGPVSLQAPFVRGQSGGGLYRSCFGISRPVFVSLQGITSHHHQSAPFWGVLGVGGALLLERRVSHRGTLVGLPWGAEVVVALWVGADGGCGSKGGVMAAVVV